MKGEFFQNQTICFPEKKSDFPDYIFFSFTNATMNNVNFMDFEIAKAEALKYDDFDGQNTLEKYELLKYMTLYLQPEEGQDWNRFSGYGCWCFQSFDNQFWKGQGLPKDEIDK